jgi:hypothetical protein
MLARLAEPLVFLLWKLVLYTSSTVFSQRSILSHLCICRPSS